MPWGLVSGFRASGGVVQQRADLEDSQCSFTARMACILATCGTTSAQGMLPVFRLHAKCAGKALGVACAA